MYRDHLYWFQVWEELGELTAMVVILWVLWLFRRPVGGGGAEPTSTSGVDTEAVV